jgi:hypothetical protein
MFSQSTGPGKYKIQGSLNVLEPVNFQKEFIQTTREKSCEQLFPMIFIPYCCLMTMLDIWGAFYESCRCDEIVGAVPRHRYHLCLDGWWNWKPCSFNQTVICISWTSENLVLCTDLPGRSCRPDIALRIKKRIAASFLLPCKLSIHLSLSQL